MGSSEMTGRTVVTGANAGIGRETAVELVRRGARVIGVARSRARGEVALAGIRRRLRAAGSDPELIELAVADLSSMDQVRSLAGELLERCAHIDALINNAGLIRDRRTETVDGFESTIAVNHLAPFLLTDLLRPRLEASAPARVVNVASRAHLRARFDLDDLDSRRDYRPWVVYANSKLANILFTRELARRLEGTGVTANCLHPGVVRTRFAADGDTRFPLNLLVALGRPFFLSPAKGAETSVYLACASEVAGVSGEYFDRCRPAATSSAACDAKLARALWERSEALLEPWRTRLEPAAPPKT